MANIKNLVITTRSVNGAVSDGWVPLTPPPPPSSPGQTGGGVKGAQRGRRIQAEALQARRFKGAPSAFIRVPAVTGRNSSDAKRPIQEHLLLLSHCDRSIREGCAVSSATAVPYSTAVLQAQDMLHRTCCTIDSSTAAHHEQRESCYS